ncbi:hypothetical protein BKA70DRAFT_1444980 [Coprinopsis sp. MPI-PUGE-AT-0042]|nr:hypothetical protein BKA70DRAFT_1444980 [Coprinopsis sp. MPI-PUGE-AT-0042]
MPQAVDFIAPTLMIYDYLGTLQEEVAYMWTSQWSIGLIMFYLNRYLVFVDQILLYYYASMSNPSEKVCQWVFRVGVWILVVGENVSAVIIFLQTYAIWRGRRSVVYPLGILQLAKIVTSFVTTYSERHDTVFRVFLSPKGPVCLIITGLTYAKYRLAMFILVEAATVCATIVRARHHMKASNSTWVLQLYKNGILFSFVALLLSIVSLIMSEIDWKNPDMRGLVVK